MRFIGTLLAFAAGVLTTLAVTSGPRTAEIHRTYYPNGEVETETPLDAKGLPHGDLKSYWPSGRLKSINNMNHGTLGRGRIYEDNVPDAADDTE